MVNNNKNKSVVVTGIGLVTPVGDTMEGFWEAVSKGTSPHRSFWCGGRFSAFTVKKQYSIKDRFIRLALDAAESAVKDAGIPKDILKKAGVTISSSKGGIGHVRDMRGFALNMDIYPHMAALRCAERFGCCGPSLNVISACATGLNSIIIGINFIKAGRANIVLSGGTDACLTEFILYAYNKLGVLAKGDCLPYDKRRTGFVLSEGAAVVVLEEKEHAQERGAKIYGEITGYASLGEGYHITSINPDAETIKKVIRLATPGPDNINYINTHGTGTIENDIIETLALKKALGKDAPNIPMSSSKAVTGHMLGASAAAEFIVGLLAMKKGFIPPTAKLKEPDPKCDLDYTPVAGRKRSINRFLTLSYGFGGHVCAVEVKKSLDTKAIRKIRAS